MIVGMTYTLAANNCPSRRPIVYKVTRANPYMPGTFLAVQWVYSKSDWTKKDGTMPAPSLVVECETPKG